MLSSGPGSVWSERRATRRATASCGSVDEFVHGADLIHCEEHVEHPEWDRSDGNPEQGLETRRRWLALLAEEGAPVVFSHLDGPGRLRPGPVGSQGL